jgi:hypothetical protein
MKTTKEDIQRWINNAPKKATHMIVVCDTFDWEDYPVYVLAGQDVNKVHNAHNGVNMQKVMEVYNLSMPIKNQLNEMRSKNF